MADENDAEGVLAGVRGQRERHEQGAEAEHVPPPTQDSGPHPGRQLGPFAALPAGRGSSGRCAWRTR